MNKLSEKKEYDKMLVGRLRDENKENRNFEDEIFKKNKDNDEDGLENKLMIYNEVEKILEEKIEKLQ